VEVYMLQQAEKNLDLSTYRNRGDYDAPLWIYDVPVKVSQEKGLILELTEAQRQELLNAIQTAESGYEATQGEIFAEEVIDPAIEPPEEVVEEAEVVSEETETAPAKKVEKVKQKPFDFMANRQFPKPKSEVELETAAETIVEPVVIKSEPQPELEARQPTQSEQPPTPAEPETVEQFDISIYEDVPLTDPSIKFAVCFSSPSS
jgi:hypothetical protein